jgi:hypothetical protein
LYNASYCSKLITVRRAAQKQSIRDYSDALPCTREYDQLPTPQPLASQLVFVPSFFAGRMCQKAALPDRFEQKIVRGAERRLLADFARSVRESSWMAAQLLL